MDGHDTRILTVRYYCLFLADILHLVAVFVTVGDVKSKLLISKILLNRHNNTLQNYIMELQRHVIL